MATPREPKKPSPSAPNKAFVRKDANAWKRAGWTSAPNSIIHDEDLPPIEAWAWVWMASHTETFEINAEKLWKANKHVSKQAAYDLMHNLEARGLLRRVHEVSDQGVPFMVYDLQPTPVPEEQRTAKPRKPKAKKKPPKGAFDWKSQQVKADSRPGGNPGTTRQNADQATTVGRRPAGGSLPPGSLPPGRESPIRNTRPTNKTNQPTRASRTAPAGTGRVRWMVGQLRRRKNRQPQPVPASSPGSRSRTGPASPSTRSRPTPITSTCC